MSDCFATLAELEEDCEHQLTELDFASFSHEPGESLRVTRVPLDVQGDKHSIGHLLFECHFSDVDGQGERGKLFLSDGREVEMEYIEATLLVEFTYRLRVDRHREDKAASGALCEAIARRLVIGTRGARNVIGWRRRPARAASAAISTGVVGWMRGEVEIRFRLHWGHEEVMCECP